MKIDTDVLGQELAMYRNRQKEHLNAAAGYESAAKDARTRATACAGAIEAVQKLMGMAEASTEGEKHAVADDAKGQDDAGN